MHCDKSEVFRVKKNISDCIYYRFPKYLGFQNSTKDSVIELLIK